MPPKIEEPFNVLAMIAEAKANLIRLRTHQGMKIAKIGAGWAGFDFCKSVIVGILVP